MRWRAPLGVVLCGVLGCGQASEAPRAELTVVIDDAGVLPATNDLGYTIELTEARVVVADIVFTVAGELHTVSHWQRASDLLIKPAFAHPGHSQGGEVTGELPGQYVVDWTTNRGQTLGLATLIAGTYTAADFVFGRGSEALGLPPSDPLIGHTALLRGTATKSGTSVAFTIVIDSPEGRILVGAPFDATIEGSTSGQIGFRFEPNDAEEEDTVFAGLDFLALDGDGDGIVQIEPGVPEVEEAYNNVRRTFQTHDHFRFFYQGN
ncbi:MAG: hypothetical protein ACPG4T_18890 [Nannocystaceae bacterium]